MLRASVRSGVEGTIEVQHVAQIVIDLISTVPKLPWFQITSILIPQLVVIAAVATVLICLAMKSIFEFRAQSTCSELQRHRSREI